VFFLVFLCSEGVLLKLSFDQPEWNGTIMKNILITGSTGLLGGRALGIDYQKVSYKQLSDSRRTFKDLFGPSNERIMLRAMNLYGHFSNLNVVFDNSKLLQLGMSKPSRFTDYLDRCVLTTRDATIAEPMQVDFK